MRGKIKQCFCGLLNSVPLMSCFNFNSNLTVNLFYIRFGRHTVFLLKHSVKCRMELNPDFSEASIIDSPSEIKAIALLRRISVK